MATNTYSTTLQMATHLLNYLANGYTRLLNYLANGYTRLLNYRLLTLAQLPCKWLHRFTQLPATNTYSTTLQGRARQRRRLAHGSE